MQWHRIDMQEQKMELKAVQEKLFDIMKQPFSAEQYEEQRHLHVKQSHLLALQEKYWRQRSRALWLQEGDRNSAYFHRKASNRRNKNTIRGLLIAAGEWQTESGVLKQMMVEYYAHVFKAGTVNDDAISTIFRATPMKVTSSMNDDLNMPYSNEEIKAALFQMHPSKSPGPDVIANRLKRWLPEIVSPLQSAYVPGRLISDNTLVATEVAHFMHKLRSQVDGFFSLKLDISKVYDHLEWSYLQAILTKLGFASNWINMVMRCVTSVSYAILVNGEATAKIHPTRGIKQGDPLSPYLFILCAEGLSALISQAVQFGPIQGLKMGPQAPVLHHLFFADDSLLFGAATLEECMTFKGILDTYEQASRQKVNFSKSSVVFSTNVQPHLKEVLAAVLNVTCVDEHDRYLGLPLRVGKSKTARFQYLKEKISKKLVHWKSKILSSAGKEILIKAVAQGDMEGKRKIHWRSWEKLCLTKHEGGLGFKNIYAYNLAMLAKQGWRLITKPNSLIAQVLKARYFPHCSFWDANLGDAPSYSWRSILESRSLLKAGTPFLLQSSILPNLDFKEWMLERALTLKPEIFEKLLKIIWGLWKNRNNKLWEDNAQSPNDIMLGCLSWLNEFQQARKMPTARSQAGVHRWKPANILKLNADGAFASQFSHGGTCGVLRSSTGSFVAAFMKPVHHVCSAKQVELLAIQEGLHFLKQFRVQQAVIETDCLLAVQDLARTDVNMSELSNLVHDIQQALEDMQGVQISFASRSCNKVAHRLASLAFDDGQSEFGMEILPVVFLT
ncbi:uncharacterized protein LOC133730558 [Rosa rugosa]|uniref:uncharacterized protein LOC133730558 n=1 Tax=Rosa rugosa TaxID=74645 RepID=UPI002B414204|nr:uncharacterized protein LOC133730558 [Rosa rugosa]